MNLTQSIIQLLTQVFSTMGLTTALSKLQSFLPGNPKLKSPQTARDQEPPPNSNSNKPKPTEWNSLQDVLKARAKDSSPPKHLIFYPLGNTSSPTRISYSHLYHQATSLGTQLVLAGLVEQGKPVLIHLEDHHDGILWLWAVLLAGGVPVMSSPQSLSNIDSHRERHLQGLAELLESPVCITRDALLCQFESVARQQQHSSTLRIHTVESLAKLKDNHEDGILDHHSPKATPKKSDLAILMLTSGSTGNAKAVRLTHGQILAAVAGKASVRALPPSGTFLNWIGLDHVAFLTEIHLQALWLGVGQVHVHAADVVSNPRVFLDLLSRHDVSKSFAPNFFLAKMVASCSGSTGASEWDLSNLAVLVSGGEANDVVTVAAAADLLVGYGARQRSVITPGFGMTETCAGAIYSTDCPDYDLSRSRVVACLGRCIRGIEMRVPTMPAGEIGNLEVRGDVVFDGYYRNPVATAEAFTPDGWFRTGDQGSIDDRGNLCLVGRVKDVININGVKIVTADVQAGIEMALRDRGGGLVGRVVCFPSREKGAVTEQATVAYVPREWPVGPGEMAAIESLVVQACMLVSTACRPLVFAIGAKSMALLPTSALGKISGAKMRTLFEDGVFDQDIELHRQNVGNWRKEKTEKYLEEMEALSDGEQQLLLDIVQTSGGVDSSLVGLDTSIFDLGFSSMDVIRLKQRIDKRLGTSVPVIQIMKNPTVRLLAAALDEIGSPTTDYDPIVTLRSTGAKTPLWLVHPGIGEVLVFVGLAHHMADDDRPIHALRARGFEPGQPKFASIVETVDAYVKTIRRHQPRGPYALAGYSYGTMLAFEMAKQLEDVHFLGSFNLPPHIKTRMRQLNWNMCLLHLAQFLNLITEDAVEDEQKVSYASHPRDDALKRVVSLSDKSRMDELGLEPQALVRWADVAYGLQSMAVDYEPSGVVDSIDVFHAEPLKVAAASREEWVGEHLSRWGEFSRSVPRFHAVGGAHYTMLGPEYVGGFVVLLRGALMGRGV